MTDISKVQPPSGPPEPSGKQRASEPDADKFKREMDYKVHETDTEQKKKKKEQAVEEDEEEEPAKEAAAPPPGTFSLETQEIKASPFDGQNKISPLSSPKAPSSPPPCLGNDFSPSVELPPDVVEESTQSLISSFSSEDFASPTPLEAPSYPTSTNPPVSPQKENTRKQESRLERKEEARILPQSLNKKPEHPTPPSKHTPLPTEKSLEAPYKPQEAFEKKELPSLKEKDSPMTVPVSEKKKEEEDLSSLLPPPMQQELIIDKVPDLIPNAYSALSPQMLEVFEKMVGLIMLMSTPEKTETIVTLNAPQYANSKFFGTKITIEQHKSAPGSFVIKLEGNDKATQDFIKNRDYLLAAFQHGNYNFRIQRIDVALLQETRKGIVQRKENASEEAEDQF